jgi:hypothetical protein
MPGTVTASFLSKLETRREELVREAEQWTQSLGEGKFTPAQEVKYRQYVTAIKGLADHIRDTRNELARGGTYPLNANGGGHGMASAGRLAPLEFGDEQLRRLQSAAQRGESCRIEHRDFSTADSLLPSQLFPYPIERQHEGRVLDRLPGYQMETASITFIRTTGVPAPTGEGSPSPSWCSRPTRSPSPRSSSPRTTVCRGRS